MLDLSIYSYVTCKVPTPCYRNMMAEPNPFALSTNALPGRHLNKRSLKVARVSWLGLTASQSGWWLQKKSETRELTRILSEARIHPKTFSNS